MAKITSKQVDSVQKRIRKEMERLDIQPTQSGQTRSRSDLGLMTPDGDPLCPVCGDEVTHTNPGFLFQEVKGGGFIRVPCPHCLAGKREREQHNIRRAALYDDMGLPEQSRLASLDDLDKRFASICAQFVQHGQVESRGRKFCGLFIFGDVGVGKTYAAAAVMNAAFHQGMPGIFTRVVDLLNDMRGAYYNDNIQVADVLDRYMTAPLLVLDDYGTQRDNAWVLEQLYTIIDYRTANWMPTIVTSNYPLDGLRRQADTDIILLRIVSRLAGSLLPAELRGPDRRMQNG